MRSLRESVRRSPLFPLLIISQTVSFPSAEYILEVIGAGSITKSAQNWHEIWTKSEECTALEQQLEKIHQEGLTRPIVHAESESRFPTPWGYQLVELVKRGMLDYYRNATYLSSKLALNVVCGLFVGFSFFKKEESLQGMQDKVFVSIFRLVFWRPCTEILFLVVDFHRYHSQVGDNSQCKRTEHSSYRSTLQRPRRTSTASALHRDSFCLRDSRTTEQNIQLDSTHHLPDLC